MSYSVLHRIPNVLCEPYITGSELTVWKNQNVIVSFHVFNLLFFFKIKSLVIVMGTLHS